MNWTRIGIIGFVGLCGWAAWPKGNDATPPRPLLIRAALKQVDDPVIILGDMGLNLAPILASAGVLGVAIGFGAQNLVQDFLAGIFTGGKPDAPKDALIWTGTLDIPKARVDVLHSDAAKR